MFGKDIVACVREFKSVTAKNQTRTYIGLCYPECFLQISYMFFSKILFVMEAEPDVTLG